MEKSYSYPQDLHIHSTFSRRDKDVHPMQTPSLIRRLRHARIRGISDHFEMIGSFDDYERSLRGEGFYVGCEVDGHAWVSRAADLPFDYYFYHCRDIDEDYRGWASLYATGRPVIVSHPMELGTDLDRLPDGAITEINNRYIWRRDWRPRLHPHLARLNFVVSSDAHQPNWLNQNAARQVFTEMKEREPELKEYRVFPEALEPAADEPCSTMA